MKEKFSKFIRHVLAKFYKVDELNESNLLVKFIGVIFLILGFGYIFGLVHLSSLAIFSFSLSGIFFILSDLSKYMAEEWEIKKALGNERYKKVRFFKGLRYTCLFFGVLLLIGGPYLKTVLDEQSLDILGTACAFIVIGLTVIKISLDNTRKHYDMYDSIINETTEILKEVEKYKTKCEQLERELGEIKGRIM
ncbi:hypothetical protein [Cytobacillus dafuensis]|uniref:Uncharacterized protein n=1 Tax=Cytobacillus dafuensis TaxID=1742359 RepID=A0A5B8Z259_CYTDA|nr:hypothetical protein [Cytobacillus dafuensis]QED46978.1 hypothetical protein FSZ17_06775 [Cytobacillus dafuensis]